MNKNELDDLRNLLNVAIEKQLKPNEQAIAKTVTGVVLGIAFDIGRIADASERIADESERIAYRLMNLKRIADAFEEYKYTFRNTSLDKTQTEG